MGSLITLIETAKMLQTVNEKRLREKDADGNWAFEPHQLPRLQHKRGAMIWFLREQVEDFVRRRDQALRDIAKPPAQPIQISAAEVRQAERRGHKRHAQYLRELAGVVIANGGEAHD